MRTFFRGHLKPSAWHLAEFPVGSWASEPYAARDKPRSLNSEMKRHQLRQPLLLQDLDVAPQGPFRDLLPSALSPLAGRHWLPLLSRDKISASGQLQGEALEKY